MSPYYTLSHCFWWSILSCLLRITLWQLRLLSFARRHWLFVYMYTDSHWWSHLGNNCGKKARLWCCILFVLNNQNRVQYRHTVFRLNSPCEESAISTRRWPSGGWEENCWLWIFSGVSRIPWIWVFNSYKSHEFSLFVSLLFIHMYVPFHAFSIYSLQYILHIITDISISFLLYIFYIDVPSEMCSVPQIKIFWVN